MAEADTFNDLALKAQPAPEQTQQCPQIPEHRPIGVNHALTNHIDDQKAIQAESQKSAPVQEDEQPKTGFKAWWAKLSTSKKKGIFVASTLLLTALILAVLLIYFVALKNRVEYFSDRATSYRLNQTKQIVTKIPVVLTEPKLFSKNEITQAYYVTFSKENQSDTNKTQGYLVLTDEESGITIKSINSTNNIIEIDPKQLLKYLQAQNPAEVKRLLAYAQLTDSQQIYDKQSAAKLLDEVAVLGNMANYNTQLVLQRQFRGKATKDGYEIQTAQSSRLDKFVGNRKLSFFSNLFGSIAGVFVGLFKKILGIKDEAPVTNIYNTNINKNITVINAGPRSTVVAGDNNNVNNNQNGPSNSNRNRNPQPNTIQQQKFKSKVTTIQTQTKTTKSVTSVSGVKNTGSSRPSVPTPSSSPKPAARHQMTFSRPASKRVLTQENPQKQANSQTSTQRQQNISRSQQGSISMRAFQSAIKCTDVGEYKRCSAEEWQASNTPHVRTQESLKNKENYQVDHIFVIGLQEMLLGLHQDSQPARSA